MLETITWIALTLGISKLQAALMIIGFGVLGGYAMSNKTNATEPSEPKKVEVNINPIDLWELKRMQK